MGLANLPAPAEGILCVFLVNTAFSISLVKAVVRSILQIIGIHLQSPSPEYVGNSREEPYECFSGAAESYIEEFRSRNPSTKFNDICSCKRHEQDCVVCLTRFKPDSDINRLSCGHLFHKVCLEKWLDYMNVTCPLCRSPLMPEEEDLYSLW